MPELLTSTDVAAARLVAEQAQEDYDRALRDAVKYKAPTSQLADLSFRAQLAVVRAIELETDYDVQQALVPQREAAEQAATSFVDERATELATSRDRAITAIADAERVMREMLGALDEYNALVRQTAAELVQRGLSIRDCLHDEHETGGAGRLEGDAARLCGEWWYPVDTAAALMVSIFAVAHSAWGRYHPLTASFQYVRYRGQSVFHRTGL